MFFKKKNNEPIKLSYVDANITITMHSGAVFTKDFESIIENDIVKQHGYTQAIVYLSGISTSCIFSLDNINFYNTKDIQHIHLQEIELFRNVLPKQE